MQLQLRPLAVATLATLLTSASAFAQTEPVQKDLLPPGGKWAAQTSLTQATLVWYNPLAGRPIPTTLKDNEPAGFRIWRQVPAGTGELVPLTRLSAGGSRAILPLAQSTSPQRFYIAAINSKGSRSELAPFNDITREDSPMGVFTTPAPVTASETAPGQVTVTWTAVAGATAYTLGRSVAPNGFRSLCSICPTVTRFVDTVTTPGAKHIYAVSAVTRLGVKGSARSNDIVPAASGVVGPDNPDKQADDDAPKAPTSVTAVYTNGRVNIMWTMPASPAALRIYRSVSAPSEKTGVTTDVTITPVDVKIGDASGSSRSFVDWNPPNVGQVMYGVQAVYPKGLSPVVRSNTIDLAKQTIVSVPPPAVTGPKGVVIAEGIKLTWNPSVGATGYRIRRALGAYGAFETMRDVTGTEYIDITPNLLKMNPRYQIIAMNPKGSSQPVNVTISTITGGE